MTALLVPLLGLAACSSGGDSETTTSPSSRVAPSALPEGKGSGAADGVFPRTVAHWAGSTTVPAAPSRVVVISTGQMDAVLTLGVVPIGSTSPTGGAAVPEYLKKKFADKAKQLGRIADVGSRNEPNIEAVANLKPDLILVNAAGKDLDKLFASLSKVAPTVVTQGTGVNWKPDMLLVADALGKTDEAKRWLDSYHADAAKLGDSVEGSPTVSFVRRTADRTRVFGVASFPGSIAEDAGLTRPESQRFPDTSEDISAEQLQKADGDRIFYGVQGGKAEALTSLPLWPTLKGVADGHAVAVDDDPFYLNAGPTAARVVLDQLTTSLA